MHKDSKLEKDGGCIFEKDGIFYNCAFALCDLGNDMNQYVFVFSFTFFVFSYTCVCFGGWGLSVESKVQ